MPTQPLQVRLLSFWPLQMGGWLLYAMALILSNAPMLHHRDLVAFRSTFLVCSFAESFLLYGICHTLWRRRTDLLRSLIICSLASLLFGFATTAAALRAESRMNGEARYYTWENMLASTPGAAFLLIAWSALYFGLKHYQLSEIESSRARAAEASSRKAQWAALRYQLQPHFLFNTLNAISSLVVLGQSTAATEMIARLADLLRSSLEAPDKHMVSLADEVRVANEYLAIEKVRFGDRLVVSFDLEPDTLDILVPRFILQPLLENAVRHGVAHVSGRATISVRSRRKNALVHMTVQNDCHARISSAPATSGFGLANTRARLEQLHGSSASIANTYLPNGQYLVDVILPITPATGVIDRAS